MSGVLRPDEQFVALIPSLARDLGSAKAALILQYLNFHADASGVVKATLEEIAEGTGCSKRSVQRHLLLLRDDGVLVAKRTSFSDATKSYRIDHNVLNGMAISSTSKEDTLATSNVDSLATLDVDSLATSLSIKGSKNSTPPQRFDEWWSAYPHKREKRAAEKAYVAAANRVGESVLLDALARQREVLAEAMARGFCPYPATWLNKGKYEDEIAAEPTTEWEQMERYQ